MQEQLKNIFVSLEVAKIAKEKGFSEWCAAYYSVRHETIFSNIHGFSNLLADCDNPEECIELPTQFQLIQWLITNHKICILQESTEIWKVDFNLRSGWFGQVCISTINDALIFALNLVEQ